MRLQDKEVAVIATPNIPMGYVGIPYRLLQQLQVEVGDLIDLEAGGLGRFFVTWPAEDEWEKVYKELGYAQDEFIFMNEKMDVPFSYDINFKPLDKRSETLQKVAKAAADYVPDPPIIIDYSDVPELSNPMTYKKAQHTLELLKARAEERDAVPSTEDSKAARQMIAAVVGEEAIKDFDIEAWKDGRRYCVRAYYKPCVVTVSRSDTLTGTVVTALVAGLTPELSKLQDDINGIITKIPTEPEMVVRAILNSDSDSPVNMEHKTN
jgi:hypothetical protein